MLIRAYRIRGHFHAKLDPLGLADRKHMLGIGLHSYGFTEAAFLWLIAFVVSQLLVMGLAFIPEQKPQVVA